MNLSYEIFLSGNFESVYIYSYRHERYDYTPIVLSSLVPKLYTMGYIFNLDEDDLFIDVDTVETVDMEIVETDLLTHSLHLIKDGITYYVLGKHDKKTGIFANISQENMKVINDYFVENKVRVGLERLTIDLEDEKGNAVEVISAKISSMVIQEGCELLVDAEFEEFVDVLLNFGSMTQRGEVVEWDSDDFSNLINLKVFKKLTNRSPNNKKIEDQIIPTLNSIVRKQIINSLERMRDNKRAFLVAQDLPMVDEIEDERTIINIGEFTNLLSVISTVNGYDVATPDITYYKALNKYVIKIINDAIKIIYIIAAKI